MQNIRRFISSDLYIIFVVLIGLTIWHFQPSFIISLIIIASLVLFVTLTQKSSEAFIPIFMVMLVSNIFGNSHLEGDQISPMIEIGALEVSLVSIILLCLILFFILNFKKQNKPKLWIGLLFMIVSFAISGVREHVGTFTENRFLDTYSMIVILFIYLFFSFTMGKNKKEYISKVLIYFSLFLSLQIFIWYILDYDYLGQVTLRPFLKWGNANAGSLFILLTVGGGTYLYLKNNNPFYFILTKISLIAVFISTSRGGALCAIPAWLFSDILILIASKNRKFYLLTYSAFIACVLVLLIVFFEPASTIINMVVDRFFQGDNLDDFSSHRIYLYQLAIESFKSSKWIGIGTSFSVSFNTTPWYHSTILEILASTGIVGVVLHLVHFIQKYLLLSKNIKDPFISSLFIGIFSSSIYGLIDVTYSNFMWMFIFVIILACMESQLKVETLSTQKQ